MIIVWFYQRTLTEFFMNGFRKDIDMVLTSKGEILKYKK